MPGEQPIEVPVQGGEPSVPTESVRPPVEAPAEGQDAGANPEVKRLVENIKKASEGLTEEERKELALRAIAEAKQRQAEEGHQAATVTEKPKKEKRQSRFKNTLTSMKEFPGKVVNTIKKTASSIVSTAYNIISYPFRLPGIIYRKIFRRPTPQRESSAGSSQPGY